MGILRMKVRNVTPEEGDDGIFVRKRRLDVFLPIHSGIKDNVQEEAGVDTSINVSKAGENGVEVHIGLLHNG